MLQSSKVVNIGGFNLSTLSANILGSKDRGLSQLFKKLYANNEKGFAYDPLDATVAKVASRRNLMIESEFRNGISDIGTRGGTFSAATFEGLNEGTGIRLDPNATGTFVYKGFNFTAGLPYVFSCFVRTLDGSVPVLGDSSESATTDFCLVAKGAVIFSPNISLVSMGNGLYRAVGIVTASSTNTNFGVMKYAGNSAKPIVVSGYQLEQASAVSEYQPFRTIPLEYSSLSLWQDASGSNPVSGSNQPVGLMLDKSRGLALGAELFANQPSVIDNVAGGAVLTHNAATRSVTITSAGVTNGYPRLSVNLGLVVGEHYLVQGKITGNGKVNGIRLATAGNINQMNYDFVTGIFSGIQIAASSVINMLIDGTQVGTLTISELSVKKVSGFHAYQAMSAQRPLFQNGKIVFDRVDDNLMTTMPSELTGCTVFRSVPNLGTKISFNQTIPANYVDNTSHAGLVAIDRALNAFEKAELISNFDRRAGASNIDSLSYKAFNGEQGFVYDPSDLSTIYQDASGTLPAVAGQPVGLILDKSKNLELGVEKSAYPSGFGSLTGIGTVGATLSLSGTELVATAQDGNADRAEITIAGLTVGKFYKIEVLARRPVASGSQILSLSTFTNVPNTPVTSLTYQKYTFIAAATATSGLLRAYAADASGTGAVGDKIYVYSVSVREVAGNHASQSVTAARPTLGRHPFVGARNFVPYSEDPTKWQSTATGTGTVPVLTYGAPAPDGTNTATLAVFDKGAGGLISDSSNVFIIPPANVPTTLGSSYTATVWLRTSDSTTKQFRFDFNGFTPDSGTSGLINVTGVYQKFTIKLASATSTSNVMTLRLRGTQATSDQASIHIWQPQQEAGLTPTNYQKTVSLLDVTEAGQSDCWYMKFDGIDDFLQTQPIDFTATDKVSLFAGVKEFASSVKIICELSPDMNANAGSFYLTADDATNKYRFKSRGTAPPNTGMIALSLDQPPTSGVVLTATGNISGDLNTIRANGVQGDIGGSIELGAGNYGNYPLYIGRRNGSALALDGNIYGLGCIGRTFTSFEAQAFEKVLAKNTGVTLSV